MDDVEDLLDRVRPAGPPASLRSRVVESASRADRDLREWIVPVLAAVAVIVLYALADQSRTAAVAGHASDPLIAGTAQRFTEVLGGGQFAAQIANALARAEVSEERRDESR